jgi:methyltransferase (TIGR00027 family)
VLAEQGALAGCARHVVPIDLRADWPGALLRASFDPQRPTAWLAEGLLGYLPATVVEALFANVHRLSATGSWFAAEEVDSDLRDRMDNPAFRDFQRRLGLNMDTLLPDDDRPNSDRPNADRWFRDHEWRVTANGRAQAANQYGRALSESAGDIVNKGTLLIARLS